MYLVRDPAQFEVIVTNNLFGDIVTDLGAALQGGLGMAASAQPASRGTSHVRARARLGAAARRQEHRQPDGGAILSAALMLETLGSADEARAIETAVREAIDAGVGTTDVGGTLGTRETGDWIAKRIQR